MKRLSKNWITENSTDFELKQYVVLGYLQQVYKMFKDSKVEPLLYDVKHHYQLLQQFCTSRDSLLNNSPKNLLGFDWKNLEVKYDSTSLPGLEDIERIVDFAMPKFANAVQSGEELCKSLIDSLKIEPIGIVPIYQKEGYLILQNSYQSSSIVYRYSSYSESSTSNYNYAYVSCYEKSLSSTYESIKMNLIETSELPVPATYLIYSSQKLPLRASFLPLAKVAFEDYHKYEQ